MLVVTETKSIPDKPLKRQEKAGALVNDVFRRKESQWAWDRDSKDLVKVVRLVDRSAVFAAVVARPPYRRVMWCSLMA